MYNFLLMFHNLFRWISILLAIYALYNNYSGWKNNKNFTRKDKALNSALVGTFDLQLIIGLLLYFFYSLNTRRAFEDMGMAMKNAELRYWSVEHIGGMLVAIIIAHIGSAVSKRANTNSEKFRKAFIYFTIAIVIILLNLPYSFHGGSRPLNPFDHF